MSEGDKLLIPIYAMNTDKDIWGTDALEFRCALIQSKGYSCSERVLTLHRNTRPERWDSPPEAISENPGVWSNLMTFLGGPRACIGYQFTLIESVRCLFLPPQSSFAKILITLTAQDEMSFVCAYSKVRVRASPSRRRYRMAEPGGGSATVRQGCRARWTQFTVIRQAPRP